MTFITEMLVEIWSTLGEMAPYLLFGFLVAGILSVFISPELVEKHLGGRGFWPIIKASLFGVPLPLCSCGVIPVAASLRRHGSSKGATTAFLLSTPQTGVDSIFATFSLLGPVFAIFRPLAAFVTGILGGSVIEALGDDETSAEKVEVCEDACCRPSGHHSKLARVAHYGFVTLPKDIGKPLLVGLVIAGGIAAFIPDTFFSATLGQGFLAMLVMMALGIPIYVCATASIPIAAAMMMKGISPGAALVFLMTGPATNAAAIATLWKVLGKRTAIVYLVIVAVTSLGSGLLLDLLFQIGDLTLGHLAHWMLPQQAKTAAAVILLLILAIGLLPRKTRPPETTHSAEDASETTLTVEGMTCSHCADTVRRTLNKLAGVTSASVLLEQKKAVVTGTNVDLEGMKTAVEALGYKATLMGSPGGNSNDR